MTCTRRYHDRGQCSECSKLIDLWHEVIDGRKGRGLCGECCPVCNPKEARAGGGKGHVRSGVKHSQYRLFRGRHSS